MIFAVSAACASEPSQPRERPRIEAAVERGLGERVHVPLRVRCVWIPPRCRATLPDGSHLPVWLGVRHGEIVWRLDGALVFADDIEAYLREALADLGAPQTAECGARVQAIAARDRVPCQLQHGGKAFVTVNADGTTSIEIVLDPVAAAARAEPVSDESLLQMSRKLEHADGDDEE